jgi:flagellar protein FlaG
MSVQAVSASLPPQVSLEASAVAREAKAVVTPLGGQTAQSAQPAQPVSSEQLNAAVKSVREFVGTINNNLEFSINDDTQQVVVKIIDSSTKEVIRQIPSEEMVAMAKALDSIKGLFIKQTA